jgi:hypothetical protein
LISRAVAPSLTTRTVSVKEMLTQLDAARHRWTRRHAGIAVGAMAAAGLAVFALSAARKNHGDLADAKYMVASVGAADSVTSDAVRSVAERMGDWRDVNVVDQAMDPNTAPSARTTTIQDALATSRRLGARNLIVVDAHTGSDTIAIEASIYDAASDTLVKKRRVAIPRSMSSASRIDASRTLVNGLVRDGEQLPWRSSLDHSHPSLAAWRAYDSGRAAIRQWDLRSAERAFRDALTLEGSLGIAHLWLAQTLAWANAPKRNEQSTEALSAETNGSSLTRRDSIVAEGLIALAARDSSDACAPFRRLLVRDTRDFAAWVGLGDCQAHDPLVLRDRRSSTGWVFRSSYEDAARAYRRAAVIGGSPGTGFQGWLLGRLSHVLVSATNLVRTGYAQSQRNVVMGSRPFLDHDTVAYAPYPMIGFRTLSGERDHKLLLLAANRNRTLLKRYAEEWVQTSPADGAAYDSLASLSQLTDGFGTVGGVAVPTRELLHRARRLLSDSTEQVRLAIAEVQELLKADSVVDARRKADSLIERNVMRRFPTVPGMLGFAALLGRIRETVWLLAQQPGSSQVMLTDGSPWSSPKPIADAAASLNIYAVFGAPLDSVRVLARRTVDLVRNYVPDSAQADSILSVLVAAPLSYVDPRESGVAKYRFQAPDEAARAVLFLASGDTVRARGQLAHADTLLRARTPGDGIGFPFRLATMSLALGERKSAMAKLDGIIATIPALNSAALDEVSTMALILRSFAMRANIARALNDTKTAQTDAAIVLVLLKGADPELDPIVNAMKSIQAIRP